MATAVIISAAEMDSFLRARGFTPIHLEGTREAVYGCVVAPNTCLRVYTSIEGTSSRAVGADAIRVALVTRLPDGTIKGIGSDRRVHRVAGWRANLDARLRGWQEMQGPPCCKCGRPTARRRGKFGSFWGCIGYPVCRGVTSAAPAAVGA